MTQSFESETMEWHLKIESFFNSFFFKLRNRLKLTRIHYYEKPCRKFSNLSHLNLKKITRLKEKYHVSFEDALHEANALESYHLLDLLDQAKEKLRFRPKAGQRLIDVGSKNFYYVRALQAYFQPKSLVGVELDAYKMYRNFHTRFSAARFYIQDFENTSYEHMNFMDYNERVEGVSWFLPFVVPYPLVKWTLPLSEFQPERLFEKAFEILEGNGWLLMMNQGKAEWQEAERIAKSVGFQFKGVFACKETLLKRSVTPYLSYWKKGS